MYYIDIEQLKNISGIEAATTLLFKQITKDETLQKALDFATNFHNNQFRKSGEPYIVHPILTAAIVASITDDRSSVIAALLHDVVEDTECCIEKIESEFGDDVSSMVQALTKIDLIRDAELIPSYKDEQLALSALSFRKMLLASTKDVRVLVVKLCDRLHNMLTLDALVPKKRVRISEETLVVYAPIAHHLGISYIKNILEDLSFTYILPDEKSKIDDYLKEHHQDINITINKFEHKLSRLLQQQGISSDSFQIMGRVKHSYSIYLKMQRKGVGIAEVLDLLAVRVLVKDPALCYSVLGVVHLNFSPLTSRFKDYIAIPKENGYQTLHTTVFDETSIVEVQIRTFDMHQTAELGIAAHYKYKGEHEQCINLGWLDSLQHTNESVEEFYQLAKLDLYSEEISVFSPTAEIFSLPRGATALDFAYAVHSEIGDRAIGCSINKKRGSLLSELQNGDIVHIEVADEMTARCGWLDAVVTSRAKQHIKSNCKHRIRDIDTKSGYLVLKAIMQLNASRIKEWIDTHERIKQVWSICRDVDYLREVLHHYLKELREQKRFSSFFARRRFKIKKYSFGLLEIYSNHNIKNAVFDYCCHPKTGDEIVAFLKNSRANIHHKMCQKAMKLIDLEEPMLLVKWRQEREYRYQLIVSMQNSKGSLASFLTFLASLDIEISNIELGKEKKEHIHLCELEFVSLEADINLLHAKIERKIHIIQFIRTDDAYRSS